MDPWDDGIFGDDDGGTGDGDEDAGARLSLLYNGIHRFDASRVNRPPVFPLVLLLLFPVPVLPPPGPGPEVCWVVLDDSFEFRYAFPPVAAAATARFSSVSREIFRRILDSVDVLGKRSFPVFDSSHEFVFDGDELEFIMEFNVNCRRDAGI